MLAKFLKIIPGFHDLKNARYGSAAIRFVLFVIPLILILFNGSLFLDGLMSFAWSSLAIFVNFNDFTKIFNIEVIEFWAASFFVVIWIVTVIALEIRQWMRPNGHASQWSAIWPEIRKSRFVLFFLCVMVFLYAVAFLAPWLAPQHPNAQQDIVVTKYAAPLKKITYVKLRPQDPDPMNGGDRGDSRSLSRMIFYQKKLLNEKSNLLFLTEYEKTDGGIRIKQGMQAKILLMSDLVAEKEEEFIGERIYLLGSDKYGRDIFSRLIYGSRISLSIGLLAMLIAVTLGTVVGAAAGYFGKKTDTVLMRWVDLMLAFPNFFLILMIVALFGNSIFLIVVILGLTGWMGVARIVRGQFLTLREMEYIQAARAMGFGHARIIFKHLIPNAMAPVIVAATLRLGGIILVEAGLSFLGVGVQPPTASWGNMVADGRDVLLSAWWISTFPGLAIALTVICFNVIGDGLRDAMDPRLKG
jgi:peptide/nickel transport system permease protein